jgi:hypothetical protein
MFQVSEELALAKAMSELDSQLKFINDPKRDLSGVAASQKEESVTLHEAVLREIGDSGDEDARSSCYASMIVRDSVGDERKSGD